MNGGLSMIRFAGVAVAVLLGACATTEHTSIPTAPTYPPFTGEVQVLDAMPPSGTYERLGVVIARGPDITRDATLRKTLLKQAGEQGANAVVLQGPVQTSPNADGKSEKRLAAWAIRLEP